MTAIVMFCISWISVGNNCISENYYKKKYLSLFFICLIFGLIFGMRWDVGTDNLEYLYIYVNNLTDNYEIEFLFKIFNDICYDFHFHYSIYFGIFAFIQLFLVLYTLKNQSYIWPFIIIALFGGNFFWDWMNGMRQEMASCIMFLGANFIIKRKIGYFLLCLLIAFGFHKSALMLILLYPLFKSGQSYVPSVYIQLFLFIIAYVLVFLRLDIIANLLPFIDTLQQLDALSDYNRYNSNVLQMYSDKTKIGILFGIFFIVNLYIIFNFKKLKNYFNSKRFNIYYNLYFWGTLCEILVSLNMVLARPFRYFRIYKMVIIALLMYYFYKKYGFRHSISLFILILLMLCGLILIAKQSPFNFYFEIPHAS